MSFTLSLDSTPAGLAATLFSEVYGQHVQNLEINQADKVRTHACRCMPTRHSVTDCILLIITCSSA